MSDAREREAALLRGTANILRRIGDGGSTPSLGRLQERAGRLDRMADEMRFDWGMSPEKFCKNCRKKAIRHAKNEVEARKAIGDKAYEAATCEAESPEPSNAGRLARLEKQVERARDVLAFVECNACDAGGVEDHDYYEDVDCPGDRNICIARQALQDMEDGDE